jgi:cation diffusion facilitator family transporter
MLSYKPKRPGGHEHEHEHSHGLVDESIKRSREGVRAVALALGILGGAAAVQALVFAVSGSLALLADLIHNGGDALTAVPLGIAFALRSTRAERLAGLAVVAAIFVSACVAAYESILRLVHPSTPGHLFVLGLAGVVGFAGNWLAAGVRSRAGRRLNSPALIADGEHARVDAYVSVGVIASAVAIAAGVAILDPIIGLGMTVVILRITRESWRTVRGYDASSVGR